MCLQNCSNDKILKIVYINTSCDKIIKNWFDSCSGIRSWDKQVIFVIGSTFLI